MASKKLPWYEVERQASEKKVIEDMVRFYSIASTRARREGLLGLEGHAEERNIIWTDRSDLTGMGFRLIISGVDADIVKQQMDRGRAFVNELGKAETAGVLAIQAGNITDNMIAAMAYSVSSKYGRLIAAAAETITNKR